MKITITHSFPSTIHVPVKGIAHQVPQGTPVSIKGLTFAEAREVQLRDHIRVLIEPEHSLDVDELNAFHAAVEASRTPPRVAPPPVAPPVPPADHKLLCLGLEITGTAQLNVMKGVEPGIMLPLTVSDPNQASGHRWQVVELNIENAVIAVERGIVTGSGLEDLPSGSKVTFICRTHDENGQYLDRPVVITVS